LALKIFTQRNISVVRAVLKRKGTAGAAGKEIVLTPSPVMKEVAK
jgi:hypothetical protein